MTNVDTYIKHLNECITKLEIDNSPTNLQEADQIIDSLKLELSSITDTNEKITYKQIIKDKETIINKLRKDQLLQKSSPDKKITTTTNTTIDSTNETNQKLLDESRTTLHETIQVGEEITKNLAIHGEIIQRSRNNTKEINGQLNWANKLLTKMSRFWRN